MSFLGAPDCPVDMRLSPAPSLPCRGAASFVVAMVWTRRFRTPVILKDGQALTSLAQARDFILEMTERRQAKDPWQQASESLMKAANRTSTERDIARAADQLKAALAAEGLL